MLSLIAPKFKNEVGLYRDDGLAICKATPKKLKKPSKKSANGLKITIEANKKVVNFLDVTFNLTNGSYKPFMKPNNKLSYVHQQSNHPPVLFIFIFYFILFATLITKNIGKEEEKKRSGEET